MNEKNGKKVTFGGDEQTEKLAPSGGRENAWHPLVEEDKKKTRKRDEGS